LRRRRRQQRLARDHASGQVQQRAADERGEVFADVEGVQVDDDNLAGGQELPEIDGRMWLADEVTRHAAAQPHQAG
jgi:hypothetical protein